MEPQYRHASKRLRPFARSAGVRARGCSRLLQRVVTDFAADLPFAKAMDKLVEHYGIVLGESTIRQITLRHAQAIHRISGGAPQGLPEAVAPKQTFVVQTDGTMVPTVRSGSRPGDRRKGKSVQWQEARVSLAHVHGSTDLSYGATLLGDVDTAGRQLRACAKRAGFGKGHRVHGVGDGAPWIASQMRQRFGSQGSYLLDFYHVCEYLDAAAKAIEPQPQSSQEWLKTQKHRLQTQQIDAVLAALQPHLEPAQADEPQAPVRQCHRYLSQRLEQLYCRHHTKKWLSFRSASTWGATELRNAFGVSNLGGLPPSRRIPSKLAPEQTKPPEP